MDHHVYLFDGYTLDPQRRSLLKGTAEVALGSRALELLIALVENAGGVLTRAQLVSRVWPTTVVEDSSLRVHVAALRRAIEGDRPEPRRIVNLPGRGYSFVGPVSRQLREHAAPALAAARQAAMPLPPRLPALLGREHPLAAIESLLRRHRIITIAGPGGIGKTSVAQHLLARQSKAFDGHAFRVDLSRAGPDAAVAQVVADALGQPVPDFLRGFGASPLLLVLDTCEHVVEDTAAFVEDLAARAPHVHLVCTSREPLHVSGERVVRLEALANAPDTATTLAQALGFAAVALFVERARAASDTVVFDDGDVPQLRTLCDLLDGVPLALELAAARIDTLGLQGLVERPDDLLDVLTRGRRTAAARHGTLRAAVDWSHALLNDEERRVFCMLSLFDGSFSLTRAAGVAGAARGATAVEEVVLALVDKSLLWTCPQANRSDDGTSFRMPGLLRCYGRQRLDDLPDAALARARHAQEMLRGVPAPAQAAALAGLAAATA